MSDELKMLDEKIGGVNRRLIETIKRVEELEKRVGNNYSDRIGEQIDELFRNQHIGENNETKIAERIINIESVLKDLANGLRLSHSIGDDRYQRIFMKLGGEKEQIHFPSIGLLKDENGNPKYPELEQSEDCYCCGKTIRQTDKHFCEECFEHKNELVLLLENNIVLSRDEVEEQLRLYDKDKFFSDLPGFLRRKLRETTKEDQK